MSPFSQTLEILRRKRALTQTQLADRLGIASSYISILERGHKPPPSDKILQKIIVTLELNEHEKFQLLHDAKISNFTLKAPEHASREEFEFVYQLSKRLGQLTPRDLRILSELYELDKNNKSDMYGRIVMN